MNNIEIERVWANNDEELKQELNNIKGRVISVESQNDNWYKVIYETTS